MSFKRIKCLIAFCFSVNGEVVGHAENYHRRYKFNITVSFWNQIGLLSPMGELCTEEPPKMQTHLEVSDD